MRKDCDSCKHDEFGESYCDDCLCGNPPTKWEAADYYEPDTNAERIRRMTDEELAEYLCSIVDCNACPVRHDGRCNGGAKGYLWWLRQPAND